MINKSNGNMYAFVSHTWNTIKGKCPHGCAYCYMKKWGEQPELHFDEKELKTDLGEDNFIFVGSSCDMWADSIPDKWIDETIGYCEQFQNDYLFQSKNPVRFNEWKSAFPLSSILGTTIETNRIYPEMGKTISPIDRALSLSLTSRKTMLTIEPIMDFDLDEIINIVTNICNLQWVNIGANTNYKIKLPEPEPKKIKKLIGELRLFTEVKIKDNLKRLMV